MLIAFWIVAGVTALVFLLVGLMKLARPKEALQASGMGWVEDYTSGPVKLIGLAEVLGAIGLILPVATGIVPILSPIAGVLLAILMIGAVVTHVRRSEPPVPIALVVLAAAAAVLGFIVIS